MKDFRQKTLTLLLASVITAACSFAAGNYKNSLMGIEFKNTDSGIDMILKTKTNYNAEIVPRKVDAETYVLILPEVDSTGQSPSLNTVSNDIKSVSIRTMPYYENNNGYTKVTVKTYGNTNVCIKQIVAEQGDNNFSGNYNYTRGTEQIKNEEPSGQKAEFNSQKKKPVSEVQFPRTENSPSRRNSIQGASKTQAPPEVSGNEETVPQSTPDINNNPPVTNNYPTNTGDTNQNYIAILIAFLIIAIPTFIIMRARENMATAAGEQLDISLDDESQKEKKEKKEKKGIKSTINKLDLKYSDKTVIKQLNNKQMPFATPAAVKPEEELNIVDLDALFQEHSKKQAAEKESEEDNSALDDFLSGFSFDEELEDVSEAEEKSGYDEEFYERLLSEQGIKFAADDIERMKDLLNLEINHDTLANIEKYAVTNPIKTEQPSKENILESIISDYAIKQNIIFTNDDILICKKLLNVEIDKDFITDLRTNPERTKEMEKDILKSETKPLKPTKILTLKVKEMLPNLSEELKAQGNRRIESNYKPDTVLYGENCEVSKLSVSDLPDFSKEINNPEARIQKASAAYQLSDNSYTVSKLRISDGLPDLADAMAHPERYEDSETKNFVPDEEKLLNNLMNVTFKPFDSGDSYFEILNKPEDVTELSDTGIQDGVFDFDKFALKNDIQPDDFTDKNPQRPKPENTFIDLDELIDKDKPVSEKIESENILSDKTEEKTEIEQPVVKKAESQIRKTEPTITKVNKTEEPATVKKPVVEKQTAEKIDNTAAKTNTAALSKKSPELLKRIEASRAEREAKRRELKEQRAVPASKKFKVTPRSNTVSDIKKCIIDGINYDIEDSVALKDDYGFHLAKSEKGYVIIGFKGSKFTVLKTYDSLKSASIRARFTEKLQDGTPRYLVRVGTDGIIAEIKDNQIKFVMDL